MSCLISDLISKVIGALHKSEPNTLQKLWSAPRSCFLYPTTAEDTATNIQEENWESVRCYSSCPDLGFAFIYEPVLFDPLRAMDPHVHTFSARAVRTGIRFGRGVYSIKALQLMLAVGVTPHVNTNDKHVGWVQFGLLQQDLRQLEVGRARTTRSPSFVRRHIRRTTCRTGWPSRN